LVIFTAHSVPQRVVSEGDPYPDHVVRSASLVATAAGLTSWRVAWQSAGRTPEPWVGPDLLEVLRTVPAEGVGSVVVCPIGFVADHLEILYDLDIEARAAADATGLIFARTASLNDDPELVRTLAAVVRRTDRAAVDSRA
jgi:ferrochelatase